MCMWVVPLMLSSGKATVAGPCPTAAAEGGVLVTPQWLVALPSETRRTKAVCLGGGRLSCCAQRSEPRRNVREYRNSRRP